jgi:hypothetical protein
LTTGPHWLGRAPTHCAWLSDALQASDAAGECLDMRAEVIAVPGGTIPAAAVFPLRSDGWLGCGVRPAIAGGLALLGACKPASPPSPPQTQGTQDASVAPSAGGAAPAEAPRAPGAEVDAGAADAVGPRVRVRARFVVENDERLVASVGGARRVVVLDLRRQLPPERFGDAEDSFSMFAYAEIRATGEFEHDGVDEAIVALSIDGNACPAPWYVLARPVNGRVALSNPFGGCSGPLRVVAGPVAQGANDFEVDGLSEKQTFRPSAGNIVLVRTEPLTSLPADPVVTPHEVESHGGRRVVKVDLDGDGKPDTIDCAIFRFLGCAIHAADGSDWGTVLAPERLGVLPTWTGGHRDLVVGPQVIVRWNGHGYD